MSSNNTFNFTRFGRLFRQAAIHNNKMMLYAAGGYCGVVFLVLLVLQLGSAGQPNGIGTFLPLLLAAVITFGLLYIGYAFPAFRSKEKSFSYLMLPASATEKFLFEFITRVVFALIFLPLLYWLMFNVEGWVFELFGKETFNPIGIADFRAIDLDPVDKNPWILTIIIAGALLAAVLPFTGAAYFSKQPLIKTLFSVAMIMLLFLGVAYICIEPLGLQKYNVTKNMWLIPIGATQAMRLMGILGITINMVMLGVAFLRIKEREA